MEEPGAEGPDRTRYRFNASDALTAIIDSAGDRTTIRRDALGRETFIADPDRGARTVTYRADGSVDTETDANGTRSFTYDSLGRPHTRRTTSSTGSEKVTWDYDRDPVTMATQGYSIGRPVLVTYSAGGGGAAVSGTERRSCDAMGRPVYVQRCVDGQCAAMGSEYDEAGRLRALRYPKPGDPDGERVPYNYDGAGNLTSVGRYLTTIQHNASGQVISETYGNGLSESFSYDEDRHWLDGQSVGRPPKPSAHVVFAASYQHDATGRISHVEATNSDNPSAAPVTQDFGYVLGRLTTTSSSDSRLLCPSASTTTASDASSVRRPSAPMPTTTRRTCTP